MSTDARLKRAFKNAAVLPLSPHSKYVLFSDCHRGSGTSADNFLKNQHLYFAALTHYYQTGFTYIELGDGDELWENRSMKSIIEVHNDVFWLLSLFFKEKRLYLLFGNHDMQKRTLTYANKKCNSYFCTETQSMQPLFPDLKFYESLILRSTVFPDYALYLTHGHQASIFNSTFSPVARFLVRYIWCPLENFGVSDPTSTAKNYSLKERCEKKLAHWATVNRHPLITGHTHRPILSADSPYYYNTGSCIHPRCITCIELEHSHLTLVKWSLRTRPDASLYVAREVLSGPIYPFSFPCGTPSPSNQCNTSLK